MLPQLRCANWDRTWTFIFGPILSIFAFLPTARSNRLLNIIGLVGTNFTVTYIFVTTSATVWTRVSSDCEFTSFVFGTSCRLTSPNTEITEKLLICRFTQ